MTAIPKLPQTIRQRRQTFQNADGTGLKTLYQAAAQDAFLISLLATSDDTVGRYMNIYMTIDGTDVLVGNAFISAFAGTSAGSTPVNLLTFYIAAHTLYDNYGNKIIYIGKDSAGVAVTLKAAMQTAVTAAKTITLFATFKEF